MLSRHPRAPGAPCLRPLAAAAAVLCAASAATAQEAGPSSQLREVVVSASGFEQELKQAPASITVVTRQDLESRRSNNLAEALSDVEGVDVGDTAGKTGGLKWPKFYSQCNARLKGKEV